MITRPQWNARKPSTPLKVIGQVDTVFIHHSVTTPTKDSKKDVRDIQSYHMDVRKYSDIAYTLLVHPDGTILEGRTIEHGIKAAQGAHTQGYNSNSIAICAIGNYEENHASDRLIETINIALGIAIDKRWCGPNPRIRSHSEVGKTACCGKNLKARLSEIKPDGSIEPEPPLVRYEVKTVYFRKNIRLGTDGKGWLSFDSGLGPTATFLTATPQATFESDPNLGGAYCTGGAQDGKGGIKAYFQGKPDARFDVHILVGVAQ